MISLVVHCEFTIGGGGKRRGGGSPSQYFLRGLEGFNFPESVDVNFVKCKFVESNKIERDEETAK
jgi:hypothetical protein